MSSSLPIPSPSQLLSLVPRGLAAAEQAIGLVPRVVTLLTRVEEVVTQAEQSVLRIDQVQRDAAEVVVGSAAVVVDAATVSRRVSDLLDAFEPALVKLQPVLDRLARSTDPDEVAAVVTLINLLPEIIGSVRTDILPILNTMNTVAPDLRDLLDVSKELNEILGAVPGLGRMKRKIEERQELEDADRGEMQVDPNA